MAHPGKVTSRTSVDEAIDAEELNSEILSKENPAQVSETENHFLCQG
jgi:hypothetical protein